MTAASPLAEATHPLAEFSLKAVVDWIEVVFTFGTASQWHHVRRRISEVWGNIYVEPMESTKQFRVRFQDPGTADHWLGKMRSCLRPGESLPESTVAITGVEIAIDARHPSDDPAILAGAALYFLRHHAHTVAGLPRITKPPYFDSPILAERYAKAKADYLLAVDDAKREGKPLPPPLEKKYGSHPVVESLAVALDALKRGLTINQGKRSDLEAGDRGDRVRARFYVKMNDTRDGTAYAPLEPEEFCARMEKTWIDDAVPFSTFAEWRSFRFETLSREFELAVPHTPETNLAALMQLKVIQWGRNEEELASQPRHPEAVAKSRAPSYRRTFRRGTHPDTEANPMIAKALWCLTQRSRVKIQKKQDADPQGLPEGEGTLVTTSPKYSNTNTNTSAQEQHLYPQKDQSEEEQQSLLTHPIPSSITFPGPEETAMTLDVATHWPRRP